MSVFILIFSNSLGYFSPDSCSLKWYFFILLRIKNFLRYPTISDNVNQILNKIILLYQLNCIKTGWETTVSIILENRKTIKIIALTSHNLAHSNFKKFIEKPKNEEVKNKVVNSVNHMYFAWIDIFTQQGLHCLGHFSWT